MKVLVMGLGNLLMNDDAVGVLAVQELKKLYRDTDTLKIIDGGTLGLDLIHYLEWADKLIIVDGVNLNLPAGTVVRIEGEDINVVFESKLSPHQMGLKDILLAAELIDCRPSDIVLFGIQTKNIDMEMNLSEEVKSNLPKLLVHVSKEIESVFHL
ncbi:MAG: HyaD/HybD family hydrogenase maturation endopeptidase [Calditerrivibrio sp.]|uniref:HyaD/HybD family hydrogenase maturation endopeptidase n=1 Tax=Calditerrivibrio sp. TaxID=2792612 RepID=UPI003D14CC60